MNSSRRWLLTIVIGFPIALGAQDLAHDAMRTAVEKLIKMHGLTEPTLARLNAHGIDVRKSLFGSKRESSIHKMH
jgi:hypothetical protein